MKRLANPIEVGELFAFLGSDESSYLTGSQIVIDGGSTLPENDHRNELTRSGTRCRATGASACSVSARPPVRRRPSA